MQSKLFSIHKCNRDPPQLITYFSLSWTSKKRYGLSKSINELKTANCSDKQHNNLQINNHNFL